MLTVAWVKAFLFSLNAHSDKGFSITLGHWSSDYGLGLLCGSHIILFPWSLDGVPTHHQQLPGAFQGQSLGEWHCKCYDVISGQSPGNDITGCHDALQVPYLCSQPQRLVEFPRVLWQLVRSLPGDSPRNDVLVALMMPFFSPFFLLLLH